MSVTPPRLVDAPEAVAPWQDQGISLEGPLEVRKMHNEEAVGATQRSDAKRFWIRLSSGNFGGEMMLETYRCGSKWKT